jgi:hypothetical protein
MSADDRVKVLEGEFKLIKSELRQTLSSVRDFLLDLKIPQIQEEASKQEEAQKPQSSGSNEQPSAGGPDQPYNQEPAFDASNSGFEPQADSAQDALSSAQDASPALDMPENPFEEPLAENETDGFEPLADEESDETGMTSGDMPGEVNSEDEPEDSEEEEPGSEKIGSAQPAVSQVNLLANLIRWVSSAKKEIGVEQLPVFLDVYATTGTLTQETRDTILHLARVATDPVTDSALTEKKGLITEEIAICMEINGFSGHLPPEFKEKVRRLTELVLRQSVYGNTANAWSVLLLELHGILTGGGTSLQPLAFIKNGGKENTKESDAEMDGDAEEEAADHEELSDELEAMEEETPSKYVKPARLRLVLPVNDGGEQELDLGSLFISTQSPSKSAALARAETSARAEAAAKRGNGQKNIISRKR